MAELERTDNVRITAQRLSRFKPVLFDKGIVKMVEKYAKLHGLKCMRITSGAGQDAQNMAELCPLLLTGIFFTLRLGFPQIKYFGRLFGNLFESMKKDSSDGGGVSGFGALCAAVGGQVGTGSLVGVATALVSGGPGAIFWMWMTAVLGMPICFAEAVLAQLFREKNPDGTYRGGPAYYMNMGLHSKLLSVLFSISIIVGIGFFYVMIQSNSISIALTGVVSIKPAIAGIILLVLGDTQ